MGQTPVKRNFRLQKYRSTFTQAVLTLLQTGVTVINSLRLAATLPPLCIHTDKPSTWLAQGMDADCCRVQKASRPGSYWLTTFAWNFLKKKNKKQNISHTKTKLGAREITQEVKSLFCKQKKLSSIPRQACKIRHSGTHLYQQHWEAGSR